MDIFQSLVLGIVQGLTEFLPISSSAHLLIVPWLFGWNDKGITSLQFDVALHMGTLIAVLVYFASDWRRLIVAFVRSLAERRVGDDPDRRLAWYLVIGSIPGGIVGLLAESKVDEMFHQPENIRTGIVVIAIMMILLAALLWLAERIGKRIYDLRNLSFGTAISIGLAQALAVIPGVSRSGSTITAGLFMNLKRETAARFSFLLATPIVLGAGLKKIYDALNDPAATITSDQWPAYIVGFLAAAISGFLCIYFLLRYLQRNSTLPFIVYRVLLGVVLIVLIAIGFRA
ncbi:MAG TPA: undecaprenyl-diphosphatase UppP [Chloroflexia bacterium]|nr:undecaprenyl-diphosphatase UppP [Chloroflexia bacterium]